MTTSQFDPDRNPVEVLADEFTARFRRGECPSITEYVEQNPDLADEIQDVFPSIAMMEQLGRKEHADREFAKGQTAFVNQPIERIGDYRIIREIGRGGMGVVYEAEQESLGRHVAVKVLSANAVSSPRQLRRFQREAQAAASLHHSNIVPVFGVGEDDGLHYYVMQVIDGVGLDVIISELHRTHLNESTDDVQELPAAPSSISAIAAAQALCIGQFSTSRTSRLTNEWNVKANESTLSASQDIMAQDTETSDDGDQPTESSSSEIAAPAKIAEPNRLGDRYWKSVATIGVQLADALQYAHSKKVLHRDVKPSNLLLDRRGTVWITDFGLAKHSENDDLTNTGDIIGTLKYMAPEQFNGESSTRSDIYSLGLTLYELITLRAAVNESDRNRVIRQILDDEPMRPRRINPHIPRDLETIVAKCISREPSHRYATATELADDLQRFLDDQPIHARRITTPERLWRWCRRNPAVAIWAGLALSLLVAVAAVASFGYIATNKALDRETVQRQKAEATLEISLEALDKVYERFAPERLSSATQMTIEGADGEEIEFAAPPALSQQTAAMLENILVFYDRFAEQDSTNAKLRHEAAKANRRVADIHQQLGQLDQAEAAYLRAIAKYRELDNDVQIGGDYRLEIARIRNELGNVYRAQSQHEKSAEFFKEALETVKAICAVERPSTEAQFELARTHYLLGRRPPTWLGFGFNFGGGRPPHHSGSKERTPKRSSRDEESGERKKQPPSERLRSMTRFINQRNKHLTQASEILEQLRNKNPESAEYQYLLALCYRDRWTMRNDDGNDRAIEILEELAERFPVVPEYRFELCATYAAASSRWPKPRSSEQEASPPAKDHLTPAYAISKQLVAEHPHVPTYTAMHASLCHRMASRLRNQTGGDDDEERKRMRNAEDFYRESLQRLAPLADRFPQTFIYRMSVARIEESFAEFLLRGGDETNLPEAKLLAESSVARLAVPEDSSERDQRMMLFPLAKSYMTLIEIAKAMGEEESVEEVTKQLNQVRSQFGGWPKRRGDKHGRNP